jgi:hypothetical protein
MLCLIKLKLSFFYIEIKIITSTTNYCNIKIFVPVHCTGSKSSFNKKLTTNIFIVFSSLATSATNIVRGEVC